MLTRYQGFTIISSLFLLVVVAILLSLGVWQTMRMLEKEQQIAAIELKNTQATRSFERAMEQAKVEIGTKVLLSGKVVTKRVWILDNQFYQNQVGYKVIANVETNSGQVLVDFGWVKAAREREVFPQVRLPERLVQVKAAVHVPGVNRFVDNQYVETQFLEGVEVTRIQAIELGKLPFILTLLEESDKFRRFWTPVVMPPEKHLAYAIQWFGLAIAAAVIGFFALRKR